MGNGILAVMGPRNFGIGSFYLRTSQRLRRGAAKKLWIITLTVDYYVFVRPSVVLAGLSALPKMLQFELEPDRVFHHFNVYLSKNLHHQESTRHSDETAARIMGPESMWTEGNKERHG